MTSWTAIGWTGCTRCLAPASCSASCTSTPPSAASSWWSAPCCLSTCESALKKHPFTETCLTFHTHTSPDRSFKPKSNRKQSNRKQFVLCVFCPGIRLGGFPSGRISRTIEEEKEPELLRRKQRDTRTYRKSWVEQCLSASLTSILYSALSVRPSTPTPLCVCVCVCLQRIISKLLLLTLSWMLSTVLCQEGHDNYSNHIIQGHSCTSMFLEEGAKTFSSPSLCCAWRHTAAVKSDFCFCLRHLPSTAQIHTSRGMS